MTAPGGELLDLADGSAVVEYPGASDEAANAAAVSLAASLGTAPPSGLRDVVPGARTLFLTFDPRVLSHEALRRELSARAAGAAAGVPPREHAVEVLYGGEGGPDLEEIARAAGLDPSEFARRHAAGEYTAAFLGFAPGFAYLTGLDPTLVTPRLATPRPRVPAGSVAIGGAYTGIYPGGTPGGWRLIGRAALRLFDEDREPAALFAAGDRVRFVEVGPARFAALERELAAASSQLATSPGGRPVFRVVKPGVFSAVEGAPRFGRSGAGIAPGGAMDPRALARGNASLGNAPNAGAIEMSLLGPELEAVTEVVVAAAGAPMEASRNAVAADLSRPVALVPGDRLRFGAARGGARTYLCVAGGLQAPGRLGLTRRLEAGEILMAVPSGSREPGGSTGAAADGLAELPGVSEIAVRIVLEPRRSRFFSEAAVARALDTRFRVSSTSDRRGIRLEGEPIRGLGSSEMPPEGTALGTIQVPADGHAIVLGPDRPITGGYARIGTVVAADWGRIAQAPPGGVVRFVAVALSEALSARAAAAGPEE